MVVNKFAWSQKPETYFPNVYGAWWQAQQMVSELWGLHTAFTMPPGGLSSGLTKVLGQQWNQRAHCGWSASVSRKSLVCTGLLTLDAMTACSGVTQPAMPNRISPVENSRDVGVKTNNRLHCFASVQDKIRAVFSMKRSTFKMPNFMKLRISTD